VLEQQLVEGRLCFSLYAFLNHPSFLAMLGPIHIMVGKGVQRAPWRDVLHRKRVRLHLRLSRDCVQFQFIVHSL